MDLIDFKTYFILFHICGAIVGAGGAYISDMIFFISTRDRTISHKEFKFMKIGSIFVWTGLTILILSGLLLFLTNPTGYLASSKFLIKMLIVLIIFLNGIFFHVLHLPVLHRHVNNHYPSSDEFMRNKRLLMISGVISMTSWTFALILGLLSSIPINFYEACIVYVLFEIVVISVAMAFFRKVF